MNYDFSNLTSMDQNECEFVTTFCRNWNIKTAIEFGPGNSTLALIDGGVDRIETFEQCFDRAKAIRGEFGAGVRVHVYAPDELPIRYALPLTSYDLALIDGPTVNNPPARLNAALFCFSLAKRVMFHDSKRDHQTLAILKSLGMWTCSVFPTERGVEVLEHKCFHSESKTTLITQLQRPSVTINNGTTCRTL
jgi:hypothetical protein